MTSPNQESETNQVTLVSGECNISEDLCVFELINAGVGQTKYCIHDLQVVWPTFALLLIVKIEGNLKILVY